MNTKEKVLLELETDRDNAEKDIRKWSNSYQRYVADLLFAEEQGFPVNVRTISSRNLAKEEMAKAREAKRLYTVAINAVRKA